MDGRIISDGYVMYIIYKYHKQSHLFLWTVKKIATEMVNELCKGKIRIVIDKGAWSVNSPFWFREINSWLKPILAILAIVGTEFFQPTFQASKYSKCWKQNIEFFFEFHKCLNKLLRKLPNPSCVITLKRLKILTERENKMFSRRIWRPRIHTRRNRRSLRSMDAVYYQEIHK